MDRRPPHGIVVMQVLLNRYNVYSSHSFSATQESHLLQFRLVRWASRLNDRNMWVFGLSCLVPRIRL